MKPVLAVFEIGSDSAGCIAKRPFQFINEYMDRHPLAHTKTVINAVKMEFGFTKKEAREYVHAWVLKS